MGSFYTGKGDKGISQIGKKKIPKDSPMIEALGDLDELNSLLGLIRSCLEDKKLAEKLKRAQETLFIIQARVAWMLFPEHRAKELSSQRVIDLEKEIDEIERKIKPERSFVIPGEEPVAAQLDCARAVARRAERRITTLRKQDPLPQEILTYMNRLSSYLYALARLAAFQAKIKESKPKYE